MIFCGVPGRSLAVAASLGAAVPAIGATPTLMWSDVRQVAVHCLVQPISAAHRNLQKNLCERVRALVAQGSPVPVKLIGIGDRAMAAPGVVTLLVHASLQPAGRNGLVAFSMRPHRASTAGTSVLFGSAPRAALTPASGALAPLLEAQLRAATAEIVPWLARPAGPRPII